MTPRRPSHADPKQFATDLHRLLADFQDLPRDELRPRVLAVVPMFHKLRDLGSSLIPADEGSARGRILHYLRKYPQTVIAGEELMVVAGIQDWPRRVRELRVEFGWPIVTGLAVREMEEQGDFFGLGATPPQMAPTDYMLLLDEQDRDAAHRWRIANDVRKRPVGARDKTLDFLRQSVGRSVTGEELRYVAGNQTEWARRVRELRTEYGWPIATRNSGRPDLPVGVYVLEADRQSPQHDRRIPDPVRREVLRRDGYKCSECDWNQELWDRSDPRHLELHHVEEHAHGGANEPSNLITVCTVCHDQIHAGSS